MYQSHTHTCMQLHTVHNCTEFGGPLTILTATTVVGSDFLMPYANARTTTPNAP